MYVDVNTIITGGSLLTAVVVIFSANFCSVQVVFKAESARQRNRTNEIRTVLAYIWNSGLFEGIKRTGV